MKDKKNEKNTKTRKRKPELGKKIFVHPRRYNAVTDYELENRWDLTTRINICYGCGKWYPSHSFSYNKTYPQRQYRDTYCKSCRSLVTLKAQQGLTKATKDEFIAKSEEFWPAYEKRLRDKKENERRRIPKELHKSKYYTRVKNKLKDMNKGEEKEILLQLKENFEDKLALIEEMGLPIVRKDKQAINFLSENFEKVAKKLIRYRGKTKSDPKLEELDDFTREKELKKRKHITKYGVANALGLSIEQLDKILKADVDESNEVMIQGMIIGILGEHNDYVSNLALDNNAGAIKYLEKFGDKDNWDGDKDREGDSLNINSQTIENVLNHLVNEKLEAPKGSDFIEITPLD